MNPVQCCFKKADYVCSIFIEHVLRFASVFENVQLEVGTVGTVGAKKVQCLLCVVYRSYRPYLFK